MGRRTAAFDVNRSEFTQESGAGNEIEYKRKGGCFVTTQKAIVLAVVAVIALLFVGAVIYFYKDNLQSNKDDTQDIEKLLHDSQDSSKKEVKLKSFLKPLHYRLRIHPYLDEPNNNNFSFTGIVTITVQCTKSTNMIVINSEDLQISDSKVNVTTRKNLSLRSLSQVFDPLPETNGSSNSMPKDSAGSSTTIIMSHDNLSETNTVPIPEKGNNESITTTTAVTLNRTQTSTSPLPDSLDNSTHHSPIFSSTGNNGQPLSFTSTKPSLSLNSVPTVSGLPTEFTESQSTSPISILSSTLTTEAITRIENISYPNFTSNIDNNSVTTESSLPNTTVIGLDEPSIKYSPSPDSVYNAAKIVSLNIKNLREDKESSSYVILLDTYLEPGYNYTIDIEFSGKILNNLVGLYKTSYVDSENQKRWLVTTQLQPIFTRRVFPCFDEPSFRSSFEISIARKTNMVAISNMPLKESEPMVGRAGWIWDHFENSPPMPSHLVAFTVCDFKYVEPYSEKARPVFKIWAPNKLLSSADYAREITPKALAHIEKYFGANYPLSKIDFVAVPELSQVATESCGLILFRDTSLLLNSDSTNWNTKNHISKTIIHKLTTQWFGNLITMKRWSDLWLVEGFATYMEDIIAKAMEPNLVNLDTFSLRVTQAILDSDKLKSVRSLNAVLQSFIDVKQVYNDVAASKGSCLIRMLNYTIGENVFQKAIQNYIKNWMFKMSSQDNFWYSISNSTLENHIFSSNLTVKTFMDSWINQEGYPVVTVIRDYLTGDAVINQSRFAYEDLKSNNLWHIPLTYTKENDAKIITLWQDQQKSISVVNFTKPGNNTWVLFNVEQVGFYRVNYDETNWKLLQQQLLTDPTRISSPNRGQILNDAFELANAGMLDYKVPLELTKYLSLKERNYIPWFLFFNSLQSLAHVIGRTHHNGLFQKFVIDLIKPVYNELGLSDKQNETINDKSLRSSVIEVACKNNYEPCMKWASQEFEKWMASSEPDKINPILFDFRETVQCSAIKVGGQKEWEFLWQRTLYPLTSSVNLKIAYLSLGCTREPWLINRYLELSLNGSISIQNNQYVWRSIAHPIGLSVGLAFLRDNWKRVYSSYQYQYSNMKGIFEDFLLTFSTETDLEDLTSFYKNYRESLHPVSSLILSAVDKLKWRIQWAKLHLETITAWFLENI